MGIVTKYMNTRKFEKGNDRFLQTGGLGSSDREQGFISVKPP